MILLSSIWLLLVMVRLVACSGLRSVIWILLVLIIVVQLLAKVIRPMIIVIVLGCGNSPLLSNGTITMVNDIDLLLDNYLLIVKGILIPDSTLIFIVFLKLLSSLTKTNQIANQVNCQNRENKSEDSSED